jgi:phosphorylcholine metabolism protein LicD
MTILECLKLEKEHIYGNQKINKMAYGIKLKGYNKIIAEKMLRDIVMICDECNLNYWLEGGTLLGIFREGRLLPWDNDIDISVVSQESNKFKKLFIYLNKHNYRVRVRYFKKNKYPFKKGDVRIIKIRNKSFFGLIKGKVCFEIFVKYPAEKNFFWKIGKKTKSVPEKFYKSFTKIHFQNYKYLIPKLTEDYLKYRYGNWKKQVKTWDPEKDDLSIK